MPFAEDEQTITLTRSAGEGADALLHLPRRLGPVQLIREIGRGGMGEVWLGRHTVLARDVAVKFLLHVVSGPEDPHFERFLQEARTAAAVRHPHLVLMYDANLWGELPYLVMEYIDGPTLAEVLHRRRSGLNRTPHGSGGPPSEEGPAAIRSDALSVPETLAVLESVAGAVGQLHDREIVHRDIKPSNILLDRDGRVVVSDFGLACGRAAAGRGAFVAGTPAYMAPEMFDGRASPRSDVYALGVMSFQLLTGELPFTGSLEEVRQKHISDALPVEPMLSRGVESALTDVVVRATHKNPTFRYKTAGHLLRSMKETMPDPSIWTRGAAELNKEAAHYRAAPAAETAAESKTPSSTSYYDHLTTIAATKRQRQGAGELKAAPPTSPELAEKPDQARTIAVDLPCARCDFNLKGLTGEGACPECGTPKEESVRADRLMFADKRWLRRVRRGLRIGGMAGLTVIPLWSLREISVQPFQASLQAFEPVTTLIRAMLTFSPYISLSLGSIWITTRETRYPRKPGRALVRRGARVAALASIILGIMSILSWVKGLSWTKGDWVFPVLSFFLVFLMQHLRSLGRRIPDRRLVRHATDASVVLVVGASIVSLAFLTLDPVPRFHASDWVSFLQGAVVCVQVGLVLTIPWIGFKLLSIARVFARQIDLAVPHDLVFGLTALRANAATMAPDESVPLSLGDGRISDAGASCRRCGYRLFGLLPDGQCPECGAAIAPSLEGDLLRFADPTWLARLDLGNRLLLWGIPLSLFGFTISGIGGAEPLILILRLIFGLLALYGGWLLTTAEPSGSPNYGFRGTPLIRPALLAGVLIDVGRVCLTLFPDSQLPRSWLNAARSGLETLFWVIVTFLLYSYCRSLVERIPDQGLAKRAGSLRSQLPICLVLAAPALVASRLHIFASDVESYLWRFIIVASGLAVVVSIVLGLLALRFHYRMGKKLRQQVAWAGETWTSE